MIAQNGAVHLPGGEILDAGTTRQQLRDSPTLQPLRCRTGAPPWRHYDFDAGAGPRGGRLLATATFDGERLHEVTLRLDARGADDVDPGEWSDCDELRAKAAHDALLLATLGAPDIGAAPAKDGDDVDPVTGHGDALWWLRPWGSVGSVHDPRGGSARIVVRYGDVRT